MDFFLIKQNSLRPKSLIMTPLSVTYFSYVCKVYGSLSVHNLSNDNLEFAYGVG